MDDNTDTMYCLHCRAIYGPMAAKKPLNGDKYSKYSNGPFVKGCFSLRRDGLQSHGDSVGHKEAAAIYRAKTATPEEKANFAAEKMISTMNEKTFKRLQKFFLTTHAIVKNCRPLTDYEWILKLDERKEMDIGQTYRNYKACKEFMVAIAEVTRREIEADLKNAKFVSIMADGSTDISVIENEIVYVQYTTKGITKCYFLGLIACKSWTAQGVFDAIMNALNFETLTKHDILTKVVAYVGDGAKVNTGHKNGVIALFRKEVNEAMVMVQCMSHRVELSFKDTLKQSKLFSRANGSDGYYIQMLSQKYKADC